MKSFFELSRKTVIESADVLSQWQNKEPVNYVKHLSKFFGAPEELTSKRATWYNKDGFKRIEILDEFILHTSPIPHHDYVYSYVDIKVPHELADDLANSSESILIDHLKGEVGGRCATLSANAVTIQYVMDVVEGNVKPSKAEYEKRIMAMHKMFDSGKIYKLDWWPDETKDTDPNNKYYKEELYMKSFDELRENHLTPAEMKKREEVAKAIKRENPNMPMAKKMAIATATAKKVAEAKDPGEYDYEGDMAKNSLRTICRASGEMVDMMDENTNLPEWVQSKITLGEDYITSAYNYMMSEAEEMGESTQDISSMGGRSLARIANTAGHPDASAAKNELARRRMKNEAWSYSDRGAHNMYKAKTQTEEKVISGGYRDKDGKYHPPKTASSIMKDRLAKKADIMKKNSAILRKEQVELDEGISSVSDARIKYHALNNMPHGSYSKVEISAEHNRRKKTGGAEYAAVKPSINEVSTTTLYKYSIKAAGQGNDRLAGQKMADEKIRKKHGYSSDAKVAAGSPK